MLCEMCGSEARHLHDVKVAGSVLKACPDCAPLGTTPTLREKLGPKGYVAQAMEKRAQRLRVRDPGSTDTILASDFGTRVRQARERKAWDHETLAQRAAEKKSIITAVESGRHHPNEKLRRKLERLLGIVLTEKVTAEPAPARPTARQAGLTMGDLLKEALDK